MPSHSLGQTAQVHYVGQSASNSYPCAPDATLAQLVAQERGKDIPPHCCTIIEIDGGMSVALLPDGTLIRARAGVI